MNFIDKMMLLSNLHCILSVYMFAENLTGLSLTKTIYIYIYIYKTLLLEIK